MQSTLHISCVSWAHYLAPLSLSHLLCKMGKIITHFKCLLSGLFREWHIVSTQYMVTNITATKTTTIIFTSLDYEHGQHGGSTATRCGHDEQALCHSWGGQLYMSVQVTLER